MFIFAAVFLVGMMMMMMMMMMMADSKVSDSLHLHCFGPSL